MSSERKTASPLRGAFMRAAETGLGTTLGAVLATFVGVPFESMLSAVLTVPVVVGYISYQYESKSLAKKIEASRPSEGPGW